MSSLPVGVHVVDHPLLSHHLAGLRLAETNPKEFRSLVGTISSILVMEATKSLKLKPVQGQGPLTKFTAEQVAEQIGLVPILRAGIGMTDACLTLLPENTRVFHIGLFREEVSLQPVEYYNKLPAIPNVDQVIILDPLIATGGTALACVQMIKDWGIPIENIKFLCLLASKQGLENIIQSVPGLEIWVGQVDDHLDHKGRILPGLGDSGDRLFHTFE